MSRCEFVNVLVDLSQCEFSTLLTTATGKYVISVAKLTVVTFVKWIVIESDFIPFFEVPQENQAKTSYFQHII